MAGHQARDSASRPAENPNVFSDDFAVDVPDFDLDFNVRDGFRPGQNRFSAYSGLTEDHDFDDAGSERTLRPAASRRSISDNRTAPEGLLAAVSRNSTVKAPAAALDHGRTLSGNNTSYRLSHRASTASASSFSTAGRSSSPLPSSSGPSHPYAMYPQGTGVARSSSVTTSSTLHPPSRMSSSVQRPTHPYAMYPQNVIEDSEDSPAAAAVPALPVGFPGHGQGYHRRLGPDGEEQDIIGPDGHVEQLPPYTRFPEEGPTKASLAAEALMMPLAANSSRDAPPSHDEELQRSPTAVPESTTGLSQESEKSWREKSWKEKRNTRVLWGKMPLWLLLLLLGFVVVLAVILGGVIGAFVAKENAARRNHPHPPGPTVVTVYSTASMYDATLLASTPTGLAPLPTGDYQLPMPLPAETNQHCLTDPNTYNAWGCQVLGPPLAFSVKPFGGMGSVGAVIDPPPPSQRNSSILYGMQPPNLNLESLALVTDLDDPQRGPAFHFQARYDKLVIVDGKDLPATQNVQQRDLEERDLEERQPQQDFRHRFSVDAGDFPWYCWWNRTFIEGFIYVNQNSSAASSLASSYSLPVSTTAASMPSNAAATAPTSNNAVSTSSTATFPITSPVISWTSQWKSMSTTIPTASPQAVKRDDSGAKCYPRVIKIEERRIPGSPAPYCQKMKVLDGGQVVPAVVSGTYSTIVLTLGETDPTMRAFPGATPTAGSKAKRDDPPTACHCQWSVE